MTTNQNTLTPEQIHLLNLDPNRQVTLSIEGKATGQWEPKQLSKEAVYFYIRVHSFSNYFSTREEAEQAAAEIRAYLRLRAFAKEHDGDWKPDWNSDTPKASIYYNYSTSKYDYASYRSPVKYCSAVVMLESTAILACKMLNEGTLVL